MGQLGKALHMTKVYAEGWRGMISRMWLIGVAAVALLGILFKVGVDPFHVSSGQMTVGLLLLLILGLVTELHGIEKRHAQTISDISGKLQAVETKRDEQHKTINQSLSNIVGMSPVLHSLLELPPGKRDDVGNYAKHATDLMVIKRHTNPSVLQILDNIYEEQKLSICALSQGRINVPLNQSPHINHEIIKTCGNRMDAVSPDHLEFWESDVGKAYFDECKKPNGRFQQPIVSRIFILKHEELLQELERILYITKKHLDNNIGFAIVIENSIARDFCHKHRINLNNPENENSPRLDFALFNFTPHNSSHNNRAATFFRNDGTGSAITRFRAVFSHDDPGHANNEILKAQRAIWVELITEAWLVSSNFKSIIESGLLPDEREKVAAISTKEIRDLERRTGLIAEDAWFPYVVQNESELEEKIRSVHTYYKRYHP